MGSRSRRFRASETVDFDHVFHLYVFLFLCLGFLSRPADYGHTANSGSNKFGSIGKYFPAFNFLAPKERELANLGLVFDLHSFRLKLNSSVGLRMPNDTYDRLWFPFPGYKLTELPKWTHSQLYLGSWNVSLPSEFDPRRRPWYIVGGMEQNEAVIDNKIPMGTSTESPLNLPSSAICLDSIQKIFSEFDQFRTPKEEFVGYFLTTTIVRLRFPYTLLFKTNVHLLYAQVLYSQGETPIEIIGFKKKLCHIDEFPNDTVVKYYNVGLSPHKTLKEWAKVISIILAGIIIFVIILMMAWKRIINVMLFKSNNEFDAWILEDSDLDESYLADQILYENLLKEAELVSEGSSGKVFKVRFLELECAMKVFHSNAKMDFRKESITVLNLSHPHIVKFCCCFRKPFIIMELMDEDLYSFITKIRERRINYDMPLEVALDVMLQIAEGMSYLHQQGIAHQDLKSLNILLKLRGEFDDPDFQIIAKVADFGSARRFNPRNSTGFVLVPNMNIGTRSWRAPELFHPRGGFWTRLLGVNPRVLPKPLDAYGFAVICSELLTKQIPFSND